MRKGFGLTVLLISGLASVHLLFPEWTNAKWREILAFSGKQLDAELATLEELTSGRLPLGARPEKSAKLTEAPTYSPPISSSSRNTTESSDKTERPAVNKSASPAIVPAPAQKPIPAFVPPAAANSSPHPEAAGGQTPEASLGAILKHENRPEQMKEETFWTEEKIQEAIKNGPPKQRSAPCIAFCDKNDPVIEINTPD